MSTSRKRNNIAIAGRLTAVTLSVALLAGCTGARFMMGGDPAPVNPTGVAPATPNQASPLVTVSGKASLMGVPMANATVKVFDALTNAPAAVISAGGGNVIAAGGANYAVQQTAGRPALQVGAQSITTDGQGNFSLPLGNLLPGMAARIVVSVGGKTVTTLVTGTGKTLSSTAAKQYSVATVVFENANLDEVTHVKTQFLWGYNRMASVIGVSRASSFVDSGISEVNGWAQSYIDAARQAGEFLSNCDDTGRLTELSSFSDFTVKTGLDNQINKLVTDGQKTLAQIASQDPNSLLGNVNLTANDLVGSNLTAAVNNGQLTLTNQKTGETTTVTLPTGTDTNNPPTTEQPTTQEPTQQEETSAGPNETQVDISNTGAFNPTVTVTLPSSNLKVEVTQPSGSDDISAIYARIPTSGTTLTAANIATGTTGNITAGPQAAALTVAVDSSNPTDDGNLPPRFASAPLSGRVFAGHLMRGTQKVATFRVYTMGSFHYLVTKYLLTDAVKTNGGHTTSVTTTAITGVATGTKAEITLVSRNGNYANIEKNTQ